MRFCSFIYIFVFQPGIKFTSLFAFLINLVTVTTIGEQQFEIKTFFVSPQNARYFLPTNRALADFSLLF